jgi:ketosteroid isomerase-like protein
VSPEGNVEVIKRYLAALSSGAGAEVLEQFLAPDVVQEEFPNRMTPKGAVRDLEALKEARARGLALLASEHYELTNAVAQGDHVAAEMTWTGTVRNAVGSFAAGQTLAARLGVFFEFRDGRIARQRNYDCINPW